MIYKGYRFRHARSVVMIRIPDDPEPNYVKFGRVCKPGAKGAVETTYTWREDCKLGKKGDKVWAKPVKLEGHSRTNMAYGADGRMYLAHDGWCYTAIYRRN